MPARCDVRHELRLAVAGEVFWLWLSLSGVGRTESCGGPFCTRCAPGKTRVPHLPRSVSDVQAHPREFCTPGFSFEEGKVTSGVVEGRGEVVLVGDEEVVLLAVLVVRELNGCSRRLGLRGFDALLHVVNGYFEQLPFGGGGYGVPKGGERTHVRRWGGKGGGDRGAGALVPGAVESGMSGHAEEKWGRGRYRRRNRSGSGWGRSKRRGRGGHGVLGWKSHVFLGPPVVGLRRRGRREGFAECVRIWDGIGRATVVFVHIF